MSEPHATRADFLRALWEIYEVTGADTDGNDHFHCDDDMAVRMTVDSVRQLRDDYHDALKEYDA